MIRIGIVDDHKLIRKSLVLILQSFDGISVNLEAANGMELFEKLKSNPVDLILLDLQMPIMNGYDTCIALSLKFPKIKILILSHVSSQESIRKALCDGAHGYFSKTTDPYLLQTAINSIITQGYYFDPTIDSIFRQIYLGGGKGVKSKGSLSHLSEREMHVVRLVCQGLDGYQIADRLSVNIRTVESYRTKIMEKTDSKNFLSVVLLALKHNYISISDL